MSLKRDYTWLKGVLSSPENRTLHRPALIRLIALYEQKWNARPVNRSLLAISILELKSLLKPA